MATTKHLNLLLTANAQAMQSALAQANASLQKLSAGTTGFRTAAAAIVGGAEPFEILKGNLQNLISAIPGVGPAFANLVPIVEGFWSKIRDTQKAIQEQGKAAVATGSTIEGYSGLLFAAGDNAEMLNKTLWHLSEGIGNAALKGGESAVAFQMLGLNVKQLSGMTADKQFMALANALSKTENLTLRNAAAQSILGKSAKDSMALLMRGEGGIQKLVDMAKERGLIITNEDLASIKQANMAMKALDASVDGVWRRLAVNMAPVVKSIADDLQRLGKGLKGGEGKTAADESPWGTALIQWKEMFKDLFDPFAEGHKSGNALMRARQEMNKFAEDTKKAADEMDRQTKAQKELEQELAKAQKVKDEEEARAKAAQQQADSIRKSSMTDLDRFNQKLREINESQTLNLLTAQETDLAYLKLVSDFNKIEKAKDSALPSIALEGTSEAASAVNRWMESSRGPSEQVDTQKRIENILNDLRTKATQQLNEASQTRRAIEKIRAF